MISSALLRFISLLQLSIAAGGRAATVDSPDLKKKVWIRYNKDDTACFRAISKLSEDTTTSFNVLRQMKRSKSVLATIALQDIEQLRKSIPFIREIVPDPARYPIVGPVHDINRRDLLVWEGQAKTYGFDLVQADKLHARGLTADGVTICIVDTGFDSTHEDFNHTKFQGISLVESEWSTDENGHGTLSAGIIAAQDNDLGLIGVAPGVSVIVAKAFDSLGFQTVADLIDVVEQCRDKGARIISMSLGGLTKLDEEEELFADLFNTDGVLSVASSGNSGLNELEYPASYPSVLSIGAINRIPEIAFFPLTMHLWILQRLVLTFGRLCQIVLSARFVMKHLPETMPVTMGLPQRSLLFQASQHFCGA
jgi:predicted peroxiredoxin